MGANQRQSQRYRVALSVRYGTARDFVVDYAENLSAGGLFVRGAHNLAIGDEVAVELELPGYGAHSVTAAVAHVLTPDEAASCGRRPGAGFRIVAGPEGFMEAMRSYLVRLGRRRDYTVLVEQPAIRGLLEDAGYRVLPLPPAEDLEDSVEDAAVPVVGVVVSRDAAPEYAGMATIMGVPNLVHLLDFEEELDGVLAALDDAAVLQAMDDEA